MDNHIASKSKQTVSVVCCAALLLVIFSRSTPAETSLADAAGPLLPRKIAGSRPKPSVANPVGSAINLSFERKGTVSKIYVKAGDHVMPGQKLVEQDAGGSLAHVDLHLR